jgi:hypothetical protein
MPVTAGMLGNSSDTGGARTPLKGGTTRVRATLSKVRYTKSVCHKSIDASNSGTPKQQRNISDAVNIMYASNSKEAIAGTPVKAV